MLKYTAIAAVMFSSAAMADITTRRDSSGVPYSVEENANGIVLRSLLGETLYLGKDCDAFHTEFGSGSWGWSNAGFGASFAKNAIGFERQDVPGGSDYWKCRE